MLERLIVALINRALRHQSWARERLLRHAGKQCLILCPPLRIALHIEPDGAFGSSTGSAAPDVGITLPADAPLRLLTRPESLFAGVRIEGSVDFAEDVGFVLRHLDFDLEGELAEVLGDIPARRLSQAGRAAHLQLRQVGQRSLDNLREFAVNESGQLIEMAELESFSRSLNGLRDDLARLEKRIALLQA